MGLPRITYPITFNGRTFSVEELRLIQTLTTDYAALGCTELAATLCELVDWRRPTGRLKTHEGRLLLAHLEAKGLVTLPPVRALGRRGPRDAPRSAQGAPAPDVVGAVRDVLPLALEIVPPGRQGPSRLWRELIGRYHYLGDRVPVGATLRYFVRSAPRPEQLLACLGWTSAAWRIAVRDRWIGWTDAQRRQALPYVVNNSRFLILPWVHLTELASHILGRCARQPARRLGDALRGAAAPPGDLGRSRPVPGDLLPGGQLAPLRPDRRPGADGPGERVGGPRPEGRVRLPALPRRPAAPVHGARAGPGRARRGAGRPMRRAFCEGCLEKQRRIDQLLEENRAPEGAAPLSGAPGRGRASSDRPPPRPTVRSRRTVRQSSRAGRAAPSAATRVTGAGAVAAATGAQVIEVPGAPRCPACGGLLAAQGVRSRSVVDIAPPRPAPILYRLHRGYCPRCQSRGAGPPAHGAPPGALRQRTDRAAPLAALWARRAPGPAVRPDGVAPRQRDRAAPPARAAVRSRCCPSWWTSTGRPRCGTPMRPAGAPMGIRATPGCSARPP